MFLDITIIGGVVMNTKNKLGKLGLILACTVGITALSSTADAYWRHGVWNGNGYRNGVYVNVSPGYYHHGYYRNGYYRNVNYYGCRWVKSYHNGYWRTREVCY